MSPLGRGLASLIGGGEDPDEILERIDQMDAAENSEEAEKVPVKQKTNVNVVEDFGEIEEQESIEMPSAPKVTPLTMDPEGNLTQRTDELKVEKKTTKISVSDSDEEPEEAKTPVPSKVKAAKEAAPAKELPVAEEEPVEAQDDQEQVEADAYKPSFGESGSSDIWDQHEGNVEQVTVGDITINPLQPRRSFDPAELAELKDSIARHGILQPLVVRRIDDKKFELIAGERRLRSVQELKWDKVPCVVRRDVKSDQSRLVFALIENIQRENLNSVEEALAYQQLNTDFGLSHEEIGERIGKSRVAVTNVMRVLQLPAEVQRGLVEGKITMGHAKAILMVPDDEKQIRFYKHLVDEGLTVRKAEMRARRIQRQMNVDDPMRRKRRTRHPLANKFGPVLEEHYGHDAFVKFQERTNKFEVTFRAYSEDDLKTLIDKLMGVGELPDADLDSDVLEASEESEE